LSKKIAGKEDAQQYTRIEGQGRRGKLSLRKC